MSQKPYQLAHLCAFIDTLDERLKNIYDQEYRERAFARMTKLMEEVGELANAMGILMGHQRSVKLKDMSQVQAKEELELELADVIFTTLLVAKAVDVDIETAIKRKMMKVLTRAHMPIKDEFNLS